MQFVGYLLHCVAATAQHRFGVKNNIILDPLRGMAARLTVHNMRHILEREAQLGGIESQLAVLTVIVGHTLQKIRNDFILT